MDVLILEDAQYRIRDFRSNLPFAKIVKAADDCIEQLEEGPWDILFLDHDLEGGEFIDPADCNTGSEVARWIAANKPEVKRIIIHSHNEEAARGMFRILNGAGYKVEIKKFLSLNLKAFNTPEVENENS